MSCLKHKKIGSGALLYSLLGEISGLVLFIIRMHSCWVQSIIDLFFEMTCYLVTVLQVIEISVKFMLLYNGTVSWSED